MSERLEEIKEIVNGISAIEDVSYAMLPDDVMELKVISLKNLKWLVSRVGELEQRNEELEFASQHNGELNEFLQKRKLPPNTLGRHVVDVVMDYVEELENLRRDDLTKLGELADMINDLREEKYQDPRQGMLEDLHMENERYKQALEELKENIYEPLWIIEMLEALEQENE